MPADPERICFADCEFDPQRFELRRSGVLVEISPKTLDLIAVLLKKRDQLVTRDELFDQLWPGTTVNEGSLSNAIYEARAAVGDDAQRQEVIQTVRGRGFRLVADVTTAGAGEVDRGTAETEASRVDPRAVPSVFTLVLKILLLGLGPNAVLGYVNWLYNSTQSIPESMRSDFDFLVNLYNPVAFSTGALWLLLLARKPLRALQKARDGGHASLADRQRALVLGHGGAWVSVSLWIISGVVYPSALHAITGAVRPEGTLHFLSSLVLCGLAGAAYPFFLITRLSVRSIYPTLVDSSADRDSDRATILRLRDLAGAYLIAAGGVPLFSIILLAGVGSGERWLLVLISVLGLFGLGIAMAMYRRLQADLDHVLSRET